MYVGHECVYVLDLCTYTCMYDYVCLAMYASVYMFVCVYVYIVHRSLIGPALWNQLYPY